MATPVEQFDQTYKGQTYAQRQYHFRNLIVNYEQQQNHPYLEGLYKEYLKRYPFNSQIWNRYAQYVKETTQSSEECEKIYQQAITLNPRCYELWHCYISSVKSDKSESVDDSKIIKLIESALLYIGQDYNSSIYWEDLIGYQSENKEETIKLYRRALSIVTRSFEEIYEKFNSFFYFCNFEQIKQCFTVILGVPPSEDQSSDSMILQIKTAISLCSDKTKSLTPEVLSFESKLLKTEYDGDATNNEYPIWIQYINFAKAKLEPEQVVFLYEKALITQCDKESLWVDYFNYLESLGQHSIALNNCRKLETFIKAINNGLLLQWAEFEELHSATEQARDVYKYIVTLEGENTLKNLTRWIQFESRVNNSVDKIAEIYEKILSNPAQKPDVQQWAINDLSKLLATHNRKKQALAKYIQFFESQPINKVNYAQLLQFASQYFHGESNLIETLSEVYVNAVAASKKNPTETKNIVNMSISHLRSTSNNIAEIRQTESKIRAAENQQAQTNGESLLKKRSIVQLLGEENVNSLNGDLHKQVKTN